MRQAAHRVLKRGTRVQVECPTSYHHGATGEVFYDDRVGHVRVHLDSLDMGPRDLPFPRRILRAI